VASKDPTAYIATCPGSPQLGRDVRSRPSCGIRHARDLADKGRADLDQCPTP